ncbi:hypothetical protein CFS9_32350 [Flavobacterium sp. CFS9]|uniref:HTH araC/xylS-type domain-containing protein n=2 Tax=Flavobacterium sp. CFS9 TaxID=3143118 RepID=A0AAT9H493_9FLAO
MLVIVIVWINDAFFELPLLTEATNLLYAGLLFFLAYFSIRQKNIFTFKEKEIQEISELISPEHHKSEPKPKRINDDQTAALSIRLMSLVEKDKIFLDNELTLPIVAEKLNISIHDASFLINETTGDNFYNFINKHRVEEAKKLLVSEQANQLNMLGIAFASGFNSKTTFNTAFKKQTGVSPSSYVKSQKL